MMLLHGKIYECLAINKKKMYFVFYCRPKKIQFVSCLDEIFPLHKITVRTICTIRSSSAKLENRFIFPVYLFLSTIFDNTFLHLPASDSAQNFTIVKIILDCFFFLIYLI